MLYDCIKMLGYLGRTSNNRWHGLRLPTVQKPNKEVRSLVSLQGASSHCISESSRLEVVASLTVGKYARIFHDKT